MNLVCTVDNCERPVAYVFSGLCRIHHKPTDHVTHCEVCGVQVVKQAGTRGSAPKFCADHKGWKKIPCGACSQLGWTSDRNNKRCKKCSDAGRLEFGRALCKQDGCEITQHAKGFCKSHYMKNFVIPSKAPRRPTSEAICMGCSRSFQKTSKNPKKYCTHDCAMKHRKPWNLGKTGKQNKKPDDRLAVCDWCHTMFIIEGKNSKKFCGIECQYDWAADYEANNKNDYKRRTGHILNRAILEHDYVTVISEAEKRVTKQEDGCWLWFSLEKHGYPKQNGLPMHRVMLEAKYQAPLGDQAAHHICANKACINPDHLQPVSHKDNTAEMLSRRAYISRIEELEQVIAELDKNHPVLHRVPLAKAV